LTRAHPREDWAQFDSDLRKYHLSEDVSDTLESRYGVKYVIRANLKGPTGETVELVSVWIILKGEDTPRFVTAYPGGG
jgi:hypothetical protein